VSGTRRPGAPGLTVGELTQAAVDGHPLQPARKRRGRPRGSSKKPAPTVAELLAQGGVPDLADLFLENLVECQERLGLFRAQPASKKLDRDSLRAFSELTRAITGLVQQGRQLEEEIRRRTTTSVEDLIGKLAPELQRRGWVPPPPPGTEYWSVPAEAPADETADQVDPDEAVKRPAQSIGKVPADQLPEYILKRIAEGTL
jgi:hypothetical protein